MNREILFRGKRVDNGEWVYGDLARYMDGSPMIMESSYFATRDFLNEDEDGNPIIENEIALGGFVSVIPETVGQLWTPSNGIRVFGGDLVTAVCSPSGLRTAKRERDCKVIDSDKGFDIAVLHKGEWWAYGFMDFSTIKVIGNIHNNPDLLEKEVGRG